MRTDAALIASLERSNIHPLWDRYKAITPIAPSAKDVPFHWRWRDIEPLAHRAAKEVPVEDIERRDQFRVGAPCAGIVHGDSPSFDAGAPGASYFGRNLSILVLSTITCGTNTLAPAGLLPAR